MKDRLKMSSCIDEETMACYIDGLLSKKEIKQVEKHIATCDRCKAIVKITKKIKN
jgi:anti-sigma factor RsiW